MPAIAPVASSAVSNDTDRTNAGALAITVTMFFFWGFVAASNGIFIPFCRSYFHLDNFQSQLIGSAFYGAYFVGSLALNIYSSITKQDLFNRYGYKRMIVVGLALSAVGALCIIPSVNAESFGAILASFFVVALGFSVQQTAGNAFVVLLGPSASGAHRLTLAGSVNSFGTILGPIVVSFVLFGRPTAEAATAVTLSSINHLYLGVGLLFVAVALFFHFSNLPDERGDSAYEGWGSLRYPQVILGAIGIFIYVGVEVTIDNNFGALLRTPGYLTENGLGEHQISKYISLYWGSLMIGRWTGAVAVFNFKKATNILATILVPFAAFALILAVNHLYGNDVSNLYGYALCVAVMVAAFFFGAQKPARTLITVSTLATIATIIGVMTHGIVSVYAFMAAGLFCSVMWPSIFALSITGVGKFSGQASAFLIMMILGGAVIPPLQGMVGDHTNNMHASYLVATACFALLIIIAWRLRATLAAQHVAPES